MTKPIERDPIFRKRVFDVDIIVLCVRWYISYRLTYRDLTEIMAERGVSVAHSTILRWVILYVPEFEKRWDRFRRRVGGSWRCDETYVCIRGRWHYLYRAVDQHGQTIDFLLRRDRGIAAAQAFFRKALNSNGNRFPRTVTLDGHVPSRSALWRLRREHFKWRHPSAQSTCMQQPSGRGTAIDPWGVSELKRGQTPADRKSPSARGLLVSGRKPGGQSDYVGLAHWGPPRETRLN